MAITYFTVTQPLVHDVETSDEEGNQPEIHAVSALVTFTPSITEVQSASIDATILMRPIVGRLEDGILKAIDGTVGIQLVAGTGDFEGLTYRVDYSKVVFDKAERSMRSLRFAAPASGTVNLNICARLQL